MPGDAKVTLTWSPVTEAVSYNAYRSTVATLSNTQGIRMSGVTSPLDVTGLSNGVRVYFFITATNAGGEGAASAVVSAVPLLPTPPPVSGAPATPSGFTAQAGDRRVYTAWNAVSGATSYNLYYATLPGVTKTTGIRLGNVSNPRTTDNLTNGTTYYFIAIALNAQGESQPTQEVYATPSAGSIIVRGPETTPPQEIIAAQGTSGVRAYPNPWRVDRDGARVVTFDRLPQNSGVKIFSLSGQLVKTISAIADTATWDLRSDSGDQVASGIYIYLITADSLRLRGKLAVIR
jgi:hypothetical protein